MRILFVLPEFGDSVPGGIARFYKYAIAGLRAADCSVDVCIGATGIDETIVDGVRVKGVEPVLLEKMKATLTHFELARGLQHQLALAEAAFVTCGGGAGYDLVETTDWGLLHAPWLSHEPRHAPVVVQFHGSPGQIGYLDPFEGDEINAMLVRLLEASLLPRANLLQSPGLANAQEWSNLLKRDVEHLLPAWPSPARFPCQDEVQNHAVVAARVQRWKGPRVLCEAVKLLGESSPEILWLGGDHPIEKLNLSYSALLQEEYPHVWGTKIRPLGSRRPDETKALQLSSKFVVHPSTWDCFPLAVVEAMSAGKVVICSNQAGSSFLIDNGVNGFTFDANDPAELARLINLVSTSSDLERSTWGAHAQQTIAEKLEIATITQRRLESYRSITGRPRSAEHPWLTNFFGPMQSRASLSFLDALPMRSLMKYISNRLKKRMWS